MEVAIHVVPAIGGCRLLLRVGILNVGIDVMHLIVATPSAFDHRPAISGQVVRDSQARRHHVQHVELHAIEAGRRVDRI
jgi:hypothetical protein